MEELLKLARDTKDKYPSLTFDVMSILEECETYIKDGRDPQSEIDCAIDIIKDIVKQYNEYE